jgi:hypothetical protein
MPRATILVVTDHPGEWALVEAWIGRWRERMAVCPDEPVGCLCCVAWWDVDAPQEALDELPPSLVASRERTAGG